MLTNRYAPFLVIALLLTGCAKHKTKDTMNADELAAKAHGYIKKKKHDDAIQYVGELISRYPDHPKVGKYKILLAELQFKAKNYSAAKELYDNFSEFFPSDKHAEYARYKTILSSFYQTLPADCDQSYTEETVKLCKDYLGKDSASKYRSDVEKILAQNQERLADKEVYVFDFYLRKQQFDAARSRLAYLKEKFGKQETLQPKIAYLEYKLALKEKKYDLADEHKNKLLASYPESRFAGMAEQLDNKYNFTV